MKYFLGFLRTQLSTTTTMILVFGPKVDNVEFYSYQRSLLLFKFRRVIAGTGDDAEDKSKRWQLTSMVRKIGSKYYSFCNGVEMYKSFLEK